MGLKPLLPGPVEPVRETWTITSKIVQIVRQLDGYYTSLPAFIHNIMK